MTPSKIHMQEMELKRTGSGESLVNEWPPHNTSQIMSSEFLFVFIFTRFAIGSRLHLTTCCILNEFVTQKGVTNEFRRYTFDWKIVSLVQWSLETKRVCLHIFRSQSSDQSDTGQSTRSVWRSQATRTCHHEVCTSKCRRSVVKLAG